MVFFSCSENSPQNDAETDIDTVTEQDIDFTDTAPDPDMNDYDETPDKDTDIDNTVECLDLKIQDNVINTPFPFKDKDGKPTFCRPGCDTPTETDPQCVKNIWEWRNWESYQEYVNKKTETPDCYQWPCEIKDMKASPNPESFNSKCDRHIAVMGYNASMGTIWSHGMSNGVAGMYLGRRHGLVIEYNPEQDKYLALGATGGAFSFNEDRYVFMILETNPDINPDYRSYAISIERKDGKYYYELIHDNENHNSFFSRPPFAGGKWVLIQVREGKASSVTEVKYAKAGVWEWQTIEGIGSPLAQEGNIVGDHLTFITNNRAMYYCDLTKSPKHISDCKLINRSAGVGLIGQFEEGHSPRIDTENEKRLVYNLYRQNVFVEVDLTDVENPVYSEYEVSKNKETTYSWQVDTFRGNKVLYSDFYTMEAGSVDMIGCFYRLDKKKSSCPQENIHPWTGQNLMGYNTFWGKWHLWKTPASVATVMRDWECYCEESGVCPFEE